MLIKSITKKHMDVTDSEMLDAGVIYDLSIIHQVNYQDPKADPLTKLTRHFPDFND
jgi:hypothetical protein